MNTFERVARGLGKALFLAFFGGADDPVCTCGHRKSEHNKHNLGGCKWCVSCMDFEKGEG
jgi:hypothetical protein